MKRREFLLVLFSLTASGCANRGVLADLEDGLYDPRRPDPKQQPTPEEYGPNTFDPRKNPYSVTLRWAVDENLNVMRKPTSEPLIEGLNFPPLQDKDGNVFHLFTVFKKPVSLDELHQAELGAITGTLEQARQYAEKLRKSAQPETATQEAFVTPDAAEKMGGEAQAIKAAGDVDMKKLQEALQKQTKADLERIQLFTRPIRSEIKKIMSNIIG